MIATLPTPYYERDGITIYCADCRDILPLLPPVDLVLTDPPYGVRPGAMFRRKGCKVIGDETGELFNVMVDKWRSLLNLSDNALIVEFCSGSVDLLESTTAAHREAGWTIWRLFMLVKATPPPTPRATMVSAWEPAVISYTGKREWYGNGYIPDAWVGRSPGQNNDHRLHPAQKPIEPLRILIDALSGPNGIVSDPFMGSGTALRASRDIGRRAIGIDIEERNCEIAVDRLQQSVMRFDIPA